jgi:hypothetical protein
MTPAQAKVADGADSGYHGCHKWTSDDGPRYATRIRAGACGSSPTAYGADPHDLVPS